MTRLRLLGFIDDEEVLEVGAGSKGEIVIAAGRPPPTGPAGRSFGRFARRGAVTNLEGL
jgi:hypothetical protein